MPQARAGQNRINDGSQKSQRMCFRDMAIRPEKNLRTMCPQTILALES